MANSKTHHKRLGVALRRAGSSFGVEGLRVSVVVKALWGRALGL